ncbi:HAD-like domain-containing protein [Kockovaella imperatae]|uniref:4-nitrophenylphosphatase n=1 Tax=Kockovaella imperatae TaxID=4999 RepID=A0A1Y1U6Q8_9TREE|nr:HAD-like domain-containing protein [Kockovaella imperatae]ORX33719.1 HAD-like domain-containing protein [Kockovaella imperatae]
MMVLHIHRRGPRTTASFSIMAPPVLSTPEQYQELLDSVDTFLLDCDGVLYHGSNVVPGIKQVLPMLRRAGKKIIFVTNNASKSRRMYVDTFRKLGLEAQAEEIFGSGYASAVYLSKVLNFPKDKRVYVIGEVGLEEELDSVGIGHSGGTDPEDRVFMEKDGFGDIKPDPSIGAVLCGFDIHINYKKYAKAFSYMRDNKDCHFLLTNQDPTYPTSFATGDPDQPIRHTIFPGSGSISYPLVYASKRTPTVIGKPNTTMMDAILAEHQFDPKRALMVGDNLATDIEFGINSGVRTLLVMGGVTKREAIFGDEPSKTVPDFVMESFGDLAVLDKQ